MHNWLRYVQYEHSHTRAIEAVGYEAVTVLKDMTLDTADEGMHWGGRPTVGEGPRGGAVNPCSSTTEQIVRWELLLEGCRR